MSFVIIDRFTSSPIWLLLISFSCLTAQAETSGTMQSGERGQPRFYSIIMGKCSGFVVVVCLFSPLSMTLASSYFSSSLSTFSPLLPSSSFYFSSSSPASSSSFSSSSSSSSPSSPPSLHLFLLFLLLFPSCSPFSSFSSPPPTPSTVPF